MKLTLLLGISVLSAGLGCALAFAQEYVRPLADGVSKPSASSAMIPDPDPVPLEWTPPALSSLSSQAAMKTSFTLDRNMLGMAAGLVPDSEADARRAINKLDGVSVHMLRFGAAGIPDEGQVNAIRGSYHLRGWKHVVTTGAGGGPVHNGTTDVWFVLDGVNVRGAVILAETPKSLTLVTVAGNLSPIDLMHLRGHFGIPRIDSDAFKDETGR